MVSSNNCCLEKKNLNLTSVFKFVEHNYEKSNRHVQKIRQDKVPDSVNKVDNAKPRSQAGASGTGMARPKLKCTFCGLLHERSKEKCSAWGKKCNNCGVRNHFKPCCRKVQTIEKIMQNDKPEEATEEEF